MRSRTFLKSVAINFVAGSALLTGAAGTFLPQAQAQAPTEISFYYPVAVGGPIAKIIDGFAEGFMKENPGINVILDNVNHVYGTSAVTGTGTDKTTVVGRPLIGRKPVDRRYRVPVRSAISAESSLWGRTPAQFASAGWTVSNCNPTAAQLAAARLYVDCSSSSGITISGTIAASEVPAARRWSKRRNSTRNGTMTVPPPTPKSPDSSPASRPMPMQVRRNRAS